MQNKLKCIKGIVYHWGTSLIVDKYYPIISYTTEEITIITDYKKYFDITEKVASTVHEFRGASTELTREIGKRNRDLIVTQKNYIKRIPIPFINMCSEMGQESFINLTKEEMFQLGCDVDQRGYPSVDTSYNLIDDYFETLLIRRGLKLESLGI